MKKTLVRIIALALVAVLALPFVSCTSEDTSFKVGVILIGDETEGYSKAHIDGIKKAASELGLSEDQIKWKYNVGETDEVETKGKELIAEGCSLIIANSYGHQSFMFNLASDEANKNIQFCSMTGDQAKKYTDAGVVSNLHNAFNGVYESRYLSGVVAGLKVKELIDGGKLTADNYDANGNVKIGYVGAYTFAEVISGYTAFFLGIRSVVTNVAMQVYFTSDWGKFELEKTAAETLINNGCVIIGQHADTAGAPTAVETAHKNGKEVYCVGYNVSMIDAAPTSALTSATADWSVYYKIAIGNAMKGEAIPTNWTGAYADGVVDITELGTACAAGTEDYLKDVRASLAEKDDTKRLHVFDTDTFTVGGEKVTSAFGYDSDGDFIADTIEVVFDGYYHESYAQSAPHFGLRIDGITLLNEAY